VAVRVAIRRLVLMPVGFAVFEVQGVLPIRIHDIFCLELFQQLGHLTLLLFAVFGLAGKRLISQGPKISSIILPRHVGLADWISGVNKLRYLSKSWNPHHPTFLRA
jgi:hypothetical protein